MIFPKKGWRAMFQTRQIGGKKRSTSSCAYYGAWTCPPIAGCAGKRRGEPTSCAPRGATSRLRCPPRMSGRILCIARLSAFCFLSFFLRPNHRDHSREFGWGGDKSNNKSPDWRERTATWRGRRSLAQTASG